MIFPNLAQLRSSAGGRVEIDSGFARFKPHAFESIEVCRTVVLRLIAVWCKTGDAIHTGIGVVIVIGFCYRHPFDLVWLSDYASEVHVGMIIVYPFQRLQRSGCFGERIAGASRIWNVTIEA